MQRYSLREVVEMAIQTERLGTEFYTGMAAKFKDHEGLNTLFKTLAAMEVKHERTFTKMLDTVTEAEAAAWEEAQPYMRAMVESEFFLGKGKALPNLDHVTTVREAADFALGFEKESTLFFMGLKGAVKDKALVEDIINEEMSHIAWINRFMEKLEH